MLAAVLAGFVLAASSPRAPVAGEAGAVAPERLQAALDAARPGATLRLRPGTYPGRFVLRRPVILEGAAGTARTVLQASEGPALTVSSAGLVRLSRLDVEAAEAGVVIAGESRATLADVSVVSARGSALRVENRAQVFLRDVRLACRVVADPPEELVAHALSATGALVDADGLTTSGCDRALQAASSELRLRRTAVKAPARAGLHLLQSRAEISGLVVELARGNEGPALFTAESTLAGKSLVVRGGEHGLLARRGSLDLEDVRVEGAHYSAIALVGMRTVLRRVRITGPFADGAVVSTDSTLLQVDDLEVARAGALGIMVVRTPMKLSRVTVSGATSDADGDFGHGVVVGEGDASISELRVVEGEGAALYVTGATDVELRGGSAKSVGAGFVALNRARLRVHGFTLQGAILGALASERARMELDRTRLESSSVGTVACRGAVIDRGEDVTVVAPKETGSCWGKGSADGNWRAFKGGAR